MGNDNIFYWLDFNWFTWKVISEFHWDNMIVLWTIPIIPILFILRWLFLIPTRKKFDIAKFKSSRIDMGLIQFLRLVPISLKNASMVFAIIALARPQLVKNIQNQYTEGIDIMIALDISESMKLVDKEKSRLTISKKICQKFLKYRPNDRVGIVLFSGEAITYVPITTDHQIVQKLIEEIDHKKIVKEGTALGNAIGVSINRLIETNNKTKVLILLSDGENTAGSLDPIMAAKIAQAYQIKIYTILIGKEGVIKYYDESTQTEVSIENHINDKTLKEIAKITNGSFYRANTENSLNEIFIKIDKLEKGKIVETNYKETIDCYEVYLNWSIIFLLCWLGIKNTYLNNYLED